MPKVILLTKEPVNANLNIKVDESTHNADISSSDLTGFEILEFINQNKDIVDYENQYERSLDQHEIKKGYFAVFVIDSKAKNIKLSEWIEQSKMPNNDYRYHHYFMITETEKDLKFGAIKIEELMEENDNTNRFFFSGPLLKGLLDKYKEDAIVSFGLSKQNNNSIGFSIKPSSGSIGYYDVSYDPPYGSPEKRKKK